MQTQQGYRHMLHVQIKLFSYIQKVYKALKVVLFLQMLITILDPHMLHVQNK